MPPARPRATGLPIPSLDEANLIDISLIVCTRNRARQLARCLDAMRKVSFDGAWEVVVVDNGSTDDTAAVIKAAALDMPVQLISAFQEKPGVSGGRNAGVRASHGRIIVFTDDDCYVEPDFLTETQRAFRDEKVGYATGRVELHDPTDITMTTNPSRMQVRFPARSYVHVDQIIGANLAFRRSVLEKIGGFDEIMGPGASIPSGEDLDLAARANAAGWDGVYRPEMVIRHHHGRKEADIPKLVRLYAEGQGAYVLKHLLRGQFFAFTKGVAALRWRVWPPWRWNADKASFLYRVTRGAGKYAWVRLRG